MDNKVTICKQTRINAGSELQIYSEAETSVFFRFAKLFQPCSIMKE